MGCGVKKLKHHRSAKSRFDIRPFDLGTIKRLYETRRVDVFISIKSSASKAGPGLNSEPQNNQPQNIEGWNRCAPSFESTKMDRIPSFDIRYSVFSIRYLLLSLRLKSCLAKFSASTRIKVSSIGCTHWSNSASRILLRPMRVTI